MSYQIGDVIGDYIVTRDFDSANGGQCEWGFAECGGKEFFIKKFLSPVYPEAKTPGSEKGKQKKRQQCEAFEAKQFALINALSGCGDGGLVVRTVDCFRQGNEYGSHYFKVSQKVDTSSLSERVHTLETKKRLFVMLTAAGALKILHANKVIHLDLKPDNILIQEYDGKLISKIIDFDSSILVNESVSSDFLVGDQVYYSPELARHIATNGETPAPTQKSDIFALGLVFCQYWTGMLPVFPSRYTYAYEAVLNGDKLSIASCDSKDKASTDNSSRIRFSKNLGSPVTKIATNSTESDVFKLIEQMLTLDPHERLSITDVHQHIKHLYHHGTLPKSESVSSKTASAETPPTKSRIKFSSNLKH